MQLKSYAGHAQQQSSSQLWYSLVWRSRLFVIRREYSANMEMGGQEEQYLSAADSHCTRDLAVLPT